MLETLGLDFLKGIGSEGVVFITIFLLLDKCGVLRWIRKKVFRVSGDQTVSGRSRISDPSLCEERGKRLGTIENDIKTLKRRR